MIRERRRIFIVHYEGLIFRTGKGDKDEDELKAYNLDTYDDDEAEDSEKEATTDIGIFSNVKGLSYYTSNEEDPYITLKDVTSLPLPPS